MMSGRGARAGRRPWAAVPFRVLAGFAGLTALVTPQAAEAQSVRDRVEEGNRLYEQGRYEEAHRKYLEAMAEAPESPVIPFNDGNALYQGADYERAMEAWQRAIESGDPQLASAAWYNLGNALYRQQQLEPALEAYKQALRLDPRDQDAKHNLERVLERMQQQQQDQQDQQDPSDEPRDEEQDQDPQGDDPQDQQQDQPPPQGEEPPEDEPDEEQDDQDDQGDQPRDQPPAGGEPRPQPGEMTPEEAERLLDAVEEDPEDVNRKRASARGRRPKKPW